MTFYLKGCQKRPERPDADDKKGGKPTGKRGTSRSILTETKPKKKGSCVLFESTDHNVRSHHMDKHGSYPLDDIKRLLSENNRCQKCAAIMEEDGGCAKGDCKNITRPVLHCSSLRHHNVLCPNPKKNPAPAEPPASEEL